VIGDTIFAVSSPPGAAGRGVIRVSGPESSSVVGELIGAELPPRRASVDAEIDVLGFAVPCLLLVMPAPHSYTGEDVVEIHVLGSPLLLQHIEDSLAQRARGATPGEFTRRAFEHGRLDLAAAEAVMLLIGAANDDARRRALHILSGGLVRAVDAVRDSVLQARALIEAGLDFTEDETGAVASTEWRPALAAAAARVADLRRQLPAAVEGGAIPLIGASNAGKSSLCNALAGRDEILVSSDPGTTRDVLVCELAPGIELLDTPGDLRTPADDDRDALALRDRWAERAGSGVLWVVDVSVPPGPPPSQPLLAVVLTKVDLVPVRPRLALPDVPRFWVSSVRGDGLAELRAFLEEHAAGGPVGGGRVAAALAAAQDALQRAIDHADGGAPDELVAAELADVTASLDDVHGASTPEDVLDRLFAGFCLGK